jgi:hypothetical protein
MMTPSLNLPQKGRTWVSILILISVKFCSTVSGGQVSNKVAMFCPDPRNLESVFNTTDLKWNYIVVLIVIIITTTTTIILIIIIIVVVVVMVILKKNGSLGSPSLRV